MLVVTSHPHFLNPTGLVTNEPRIPPPQLRFDDEDERGRIRVTQRLLELETNFFAETVLERAKQIDIDSFESIHTAFSVFLHRFEHTYFPIAHNVMLEEAVSEIDWWLTHIPIIVQGLDYDPECCVYRNEAGYSHDVPAYIFIENSVLDLLMCIAAPEMWVTPDALSRQYAHAAYPFMAWVYPELTLPDASFSFDGLAATLRSMALDPPLTYLADAIEIVTKTNRNWFLDWSQQEIAEGGIEIDWDDVETVKALAVEWREAQAKRENIIALNDWCFDGGDLPNNPLAPRDQMLQRYRHILYTLDMAWRMQAGQLRMAFSRFD